MHSMIAPPHRGGRHTKVAKAQELGFDLGKEIEQAVEDVGVFREGAANDARDSATVVWSHTATWQNIARRVEERIGYGFRISESTVRHCVAAKHSATIVAKRHNPIAAVSHQRFSKAADEWNIDGHFSNKLVKNAITSAIHRRQMVLSWDDHAVWEFSGSQYTKLPVVMLRKNYKTAPYTDASPITGKLKCVTNTMLFYLPVPEIHPRPQSVSHPETGPETHPNPHPQPHSIPQTFQKYDLAVLKKAFAVTRVVAERRSTPLQQFNDLALVMRDPQMESHRMGGEITYISDGGWDHNPRNSEVRFGLTLEHLENKLLYTNASVRAAGMSSYNEAERVNGAETCAAQKANLQGAVFLAEDESLPPNEALLVRRRRFQSVLTHALSGAVYAKQHITSLASRAFRTVSAFGIDVA